MLRTFAFAAVAGVVVGLPVVLLLNVINPAVWVTQSLYFVAIGVAGLATRRYDLLGRLTVDRLHEPYRAAAYPQLPRLVDAARGAGAIGACLSGSGSAIIAFADSVKVISRVEAAFLAAAADTDLPGRVAVIAPRNHGAKVVERP